MDDHDHVPAPHLHAWHLADGTGLHAPAGELLVDEDSGRLCCHLCGGWFRSLGSHVRAHGHTAESYREDIGLCRGEPLTQRGLSSAISERQQAAYEKDEDLRSRLAEGQASARSGALSRSAAAARTANPLSAGAVARRTRALAAGRATVASRRTAALAQVVADAGSPDLPSYLRRRYDDGASLAELAAETGLGRKRLRDEMRAAGVVIRGSGQNTDAGRRSRAVAADRAAAQRVGTDDLAEWLLARRDLGWTLAELGAAVGHSGHWVRARLPAQDPG